MVPWEQLVDGRFQLELSLICTVDAPLILFLLVTFCHWMIILNDIVFTLLCWPECRLLLLSWYSNASLLLICVWRKWYLDRLYIFRIICSWCIFMVGIRTTVTALWCDFWCVVLAKNDLFIYSGKFLLLFSLVLKSDVIFSMHSLMWQKFCTRFAYINIM